MSNRTDIHSPKNFDPSAYDFIGWLYFGPVEPGMDGSEFSDFEADRFAHNNPHVGIYEDDQKCDHCGSRFIYGAVFSHKDGGWIIVGHDCASGRFQTPDKFTFQLGYIKRRAAQTRARMSKSDKLAAYLEANPELAEAFEWCEEADALLASFETYDDYGPTLSDEGRIYKRLIGFNRDTISDIRSKLIRYGNISPKQLLFVIRLAKEGAEKLTDAKRIVEEVAAMTPLTAGRQEIEGTILSVKGHDSDFGFSWKITVALESGHRVWGTLPTSLYTTTRYNFGDVTTPESLKGETIHFTGTIVPKGNDFAFFKRPSKASIITQEVTA
jgi:hypothetical protein